MIKIYFFLSTLFALNLFGNSHILDIDINHKNNEFKLLISFDSEYSGVIIRKTGNTIQKVVLNGAIINKRYSKVLNNNSNISKIDVLPFPSRTDILLTVTEHRLIKFKQSEDKLSIIITVVKDLESEKINADGESLFKNLSFGYIFTISTLFIIVVILFIVKKRLDNNEPIFKVKKKKEDTLNWLMDKESQKVSLKSIQSPDIDFKIRKNPKKIINDKLDVPFKIGTPKKIEHVENNKSIIKIIFSENIEIGKVSLLNIMEKDYLILEDKKGNITVLDKKDENIPERPKKEKKIEKEVVKNKIKEKIIEKKSLDIKILSESDIDNISNAEVKDIFEDSKNLKT